MAVYELLYYIFTNERHQKYLDNVKHPAKKGKQAKDMIEMLMDEGDEENQEVVSVTQSQGSANVGEHGQSKSSRLTNRIQDIINSELVKEKVQREFENLIDWIVGIEQKLKNIMAKKIIFNRLVWLDGCQSAYKRFVIGWPNSHQENC